MIDDTAGRGDIGKDAIVAAQRLIALPATILPI